MTNVYYTTTVTLDGKTWQRNKHKTVKSLDRAWSKYAKHDHARIITVRYVTGFDARMVHEYTRM